MEKMLFDAMPAAVKELLERLESAGFEAYAVGGCVRDVLLGRTVHDWDLCSAASPEEIGDLFSDCRVIPTGIEHGTVTVIFQGQPYELTMFRTEADYDGRKPGSVRPARTIEEDLQRRDFTINAMAYSPKRGMIDRFGGKDDLIMGKIRAVGQPEQRFREDYLRILRGLRFSACYGLSVEEETAAYMRKCAGGLSILSGERLWQELSRLLLGQNAGAVLAEFSQLLRSISGSWSEFYLSVTDGQRLDSLPKSLSGRTAFLLNQLGERRESALDELRCTRELKQRVRLIWRQSVSARDGICRMKWLAEFPAESRREDGKNALLLAEKDNEIEQIEAILDSDLPLDLRDLALKGGDLRQLAVASGPEMGRMLQELLEAVWRGEVENDRAQLAAYVTRKKQV